MVILKRALPAVALFLSAGLSACKDSLSPDDVDAGAIQSALQDMTTSFDNASFQSMAGLAFLFPVFPATSAAVASVELLDPTQGTPLVALLKQRQAASRVLASLNDPMALFPSNVLGKTFEWDTQTHAYIMGNQTGAPANGIRILLYTVSTVTGEPIVNQLLGFLELTDESTPQFDALGVRITLGTTTVADYLITSDHQTNLDVLDAQGFIGAATGSDEVDFHFNATENLSSGLSTLTSELAGSNGGSVLVELEAQGTTAGIAIRAGRGENHIQMEVAGTDDPADPISGTVSYNGTVVANISGTGDNPVFTAVSGRTLRPQEVAALGNIFGTALIVALSVAIAVLAPALIIASF